MAQVPSGGGNMLGGFGSILSGLGSAMFSPMGFYGLTGLAGSFMQGSAIRDQMKGMRNQNNMQAFSQILGLGMGQARSRARDQQNAALNILGTTAPYSFGSGIDASNRLRTGLIQTGIGGAQEEGRRASMAEFDQMLQGSSKSRSNFAKMKELERREALKDFQDRLSAQAGVRLRFPGGF